jgi:hypothetical protein
MKIKLIPLAAAYSARNKIKTTSRQVTHLKAIIVRGDEKLLFTTSH